MEEVARRAAVSTATVSRVLNHPHLVNPETRQLVLSAIEALDYRVNSSARSLRTSQTYTIAAVVDSLTNYTTIHFLEAFEAKLFKAGYSLQVCLVHNNQARVLHYLHDLTQQGQVDGILWMTSYTDPSIEDKLTLDSGHNVLIMDGRLNRTASDHYRSFVCDYDSAFYEATAYLLRCGHPQVALLNLEASIYPTAQARLQGYQRALADFAKPPYAERLSLAASTSMNEWQAAADLLFNQGQPPSAILAFDDVAAAQVYRAATLYGLQIPQDVSVIGCGDFNIATYLTPHLTTFSLPIEALANAAVTQLISPDEETHAPIFPLQLVERHSVSGF
jgi:LacI family transcriptional regulator